MICLYHLHYFLPILFMLLYSYKTDKYDWLIKPYVIPFIAAIFLVAGYLKYLYIMGAIYFMDPYLFLLYSLFVLMGTDVLVTRGIHLPQALSIAFNLAFFNSVYWELPIHIYTILYHGYFDAAFPLHVLYAIPFFFIYQKTRLPKPHSRFYLAFLGGLVFSTLSLLAVIIFHSPDIWSQPLPLWANFLWFVDRIVCFTLLIWIYSHAEAIV